MTESAPPLYQLCPRPDLGILVLRWGFQPTTAELERVYQDMGQAALEAGCRFWLQDIRRRTVNDPHATEWLLNDFFPDMARQLGGRLYVAYLLCPALHQAIIERPSYVSAATTDDKPYAISFFGDEAKAIEWLQEHRGR